MQYDLPPWSISILPDCKNVAFNTTKVGVKASEAQMSPTNVKLHSWGTFNEDVLSSDTDSEITVIGLLEQLNITRDTSDYLWYKTSVNISPSESFLHHGQNPTLSVQSEKMIYIAEIPRRFQLYMNLCYTSAYAPVWHDNKTDK